jgi:hypothetical protein
MVLQEEERIVIAPDEDRMYSEAPDLEDWRVGLSKEREQLQAQAAGMTLFQSKDYIVVEPQSSVAESMLLHRLSFALRGFILLLNSKGSPDILREMPLAAFASCDPPSSP